MVSKEIGYLGNFPQWKMSLDVRAFHEQINGYIRKQDKSTPADYANEEDFPIQGFEYQLKWQPWSGAQLVFNQSYTDIRAHLNPQNLTGTPFAAPKLASSMAYFQKLPGSLDLTLIHQDNDTATLTGSGPGSRVAMTRTDLRLSKSMRWGAKRGEIALVLQNLGLPYQDFAPEFVFRRQAFVTLRLEN